MAKWQVNAPNGRTLTINTGGVGDSKYTHGQITRNERAAKLFPQYFIPVFDMDDLPKELSEPTPKPTLEAELLKEEKKVEEKPQMLTEVPKDVDFAPEEKEDSEEAGDTILVEKKKTRKRK